MMYCIYNYLLNIIYIFNYYHHQLSDDLHRITERYWMRIVDDRVVRFRIDQCPALGDNDH